MTSNRLMEYGKADMPTNQLPSRLAFMGMPIGNGERDKVCALSKSVMSYAIKPISPIVVNR